MINIIEFKKSKFCFTTYINKILSNKRFIRMDYNFITKKIIIIHSVIIFIYLYINENLRIKM